MQPPHDIYTLIPASFPWIFVALVLVAIGGFFVWLYHRRPRKSQQDYIVPRDYVAETTALILRLRPPLDFSVGKVQEDYFFALSIALRKLITYRCKVNIIGATARELAPRLVMLPLPEATTAEILSFLHRADQIKFAQQPSDLEQAQHDYRQVVNWTRQLATKQDSQEIKRCS